MRQHSRCRLLVRLILVLAALCVGSEETIAQDGAQDGAQDATAASEAPDASRFIEAAKQYRITSADAPDEPFQLMPRPLLSWTNPERQTSAGAVFLYTHHGQPRVALCVYPSGGFLDHEFQSLSDRGLLAQRDGTLLWAPQRAGLAMKQADSASAASTSPLSRQREMRNWSRKFKASIIRPERSAIPLRLLPTPLYRYPTGNLPKGVVDGAVFAFVQGTDPEVLLVIEAREDAAGDPRWFYGLARMSMVRLSVTLESQEVWKAEWADANPASDYYTIGGN